MAKGRTISLKGAAAGAFISMARQDPIKSEDELFERVATLVYMYMKDNNMPKAVEILKSLKAGETK